MSIISKRISNIKPSPTLAITKKANELKMQGIDIISLSSGEPDFDTPEHIKQAAIRAINSGQTKYTNVDGTPELKNAVINKFKRENNLEYKPNQIIVGNGGKQILYNAILASVNPGDEVIIPSPYWVSYPDIVTLASGTPIFIQCNQESKFRIQPEQLKNAITERTKWLILNSPGNPSGSSYTYEELKALAEILLEYPNVYILSDDIYEHLLFDNNQFFTIAEVEPRLYNRTLTVNGISKSYAMTGWRIGYAGGPEKLIKAMSILQSQSTSNPCSISQAAAVEALNGNQDFLRTWCKSFAKRRDLVVDKLNSIDGINCLKPEGAFYVFPNCEGLFGQKTPKGETIKNSNDFANYLLDEAKVAVVPGLAFGIEGYFRISYATNENILESACNRIAAACKKLTV